jgi:hypothetical protein
VKTIGANGSVESVVITDPVSRSNYVLNLRDRTARRGPAAFARMVGGGRGGANTAITVTQADGGTYTATSRSELAGAVTEVARAVVGGRGRGAAEGPTTREQLGEQIIEGVTAIGTRSTTIIAAGAIGNEQPITVTSEQWYSNDLQMLVLTKHSDPRAGKTIYRVTNIVRSEPEQALFQVPADFTLR